MHDRAATLLSFGRTATPEMTKPKMFTRAAPILTLSWESSSYESPVVQSDCIIKVRSDACNKFSGQHKPGGRTGGALGHAEPFMKVAREQRRQSKDRIPLMVS